MAFLEAQSSQQIIGRGVMERVLTGCHVVRLSSEEAEVERFLGRMECERNWMELWLVRSVSRVELDEVAYEL
jgi:hypothetical protein